MMHKFNEKKIKQLTKVNTFLKAFFRSQALLDIIRIDTVQTILIIDFNAIGDSFMLEPFLRVIKNNIPDARIHLACRPHAKIIFRDQGLVEKYYLCEERIFASKNHLIHSLIHAKRTLNKIRNTQYDLILEPRGDLRDILFMYFCNGKRKVGYTYTGGEYMMTDPIEPDANIEHLIDDKMYFLKQIGCSYNSEDIIPRYQLTEKQLADNKAFIKKHRIGEKKIIGIHPGASKDIKRWRKFPELLRLINKYYSDVYFLIFSEGDEFESEKNLLIEANRLKVDYYHVNTDLREYIQKLALCDMVICNDSSAAHIAAALGVEVHVIFGPVMSKMAKPYSFAPVHIYECNDVSCRPCNQSGCQRKNECLQRITVEEVFDGVQKSMG